MDPDACLARTRTLASRQLAHEDVDASELAEAIQNLDEWLSKGGFLPQAWAENCDFHRQMIDQHLRRRNTVRAWARDRGEQR